MLLSAAYDYNKLICRCDSRLDEDYYRYTIKNWYFDATKASFEDRGDAALAL